MKTRHKSFVAAALLTTLNAAQAADFYWNTGTPAAVWQLAGNWSDDLAGTTASTAIPGAGDNVFFTSTPLLGTGIQQNLNAATSVNSITFNNTVNLNISGTGGNRDLTIGAGGITHSGSAQAEIGNSAGNRNVFPKILVDQTWTNNSTATLSIRNSAQASNAASGPVTLTLNAASTGTISNSGAYSDSATPGNTLALVVNSSGTGTVSMGGGNHTGGTTVLSGVLQSNANFGSVGTTVLLGDTSGTANTRLHLNGTAVNDITVRVGSSGYSAITGGNGNTYSGDILLNKDVQLGSVASSGVTVNYTGEISGSGNVSAQRISTGSANPTVVLTGANTYTGSTSIPSASVEVNSIKNLGLASSLGAPVDAATGKIVLSAVSQSTLRYTGIGDTTNRGIEIASSSGAVLTHNGTGNLTFTGAFTHSGTGARTLTLRGTASTAEITSALTNHGSETLSVNKQFDSGAWRLSGASTYTGSTTFTVGVLEATNLANNGTASSFGQGTTLSFAGGTMRYVGAANASTDRITSLGAAAGTIESSGVGTLRFSRTGNIAHSTSATKTLVFSGTNTGDNQFNGTISNSTGVLTTSITKEGTGAWNFTATNTYTGATIINAGTLYVNGSLAAGSAVDLNAARLGGTGTINGLVTTGGMTSVISPGNSPGTFNLNGGLDAAAGATFLFELGLTSDAISLGSGTFTGSSFADGLAFEFSDSGGLLASNPYTLFTFGSASGLDYTDLDATILPAGYTLDSSFGTGGFDISSGSLRVQFAAIPEPSSALLLLGGLALLSRRSRSIKNA